MLSKRLELVEACGVADLHDAGGLSPSDETAADARRLGREGLSPAAAPRLFEPRARKTLGLWNGQKSHDNWACLEDPKRGRWGVVDACSGPRGNLYPD